MLKKHNRKPYACRVRKLCMTNEPIMKTLNFARRMEPFVERARLTDKHYDVGDVAAMNVVERSRKGMNQIFSGRKFLT